MSREKSPEIPPFFMDGANQGSRINEYHHRRVVKCISVLTPSPSGTPYVAGVDTLYHPTFVTCIEILNIRKKN